MNNINKAEKIIDQACRLLVAFESMPPPMTPELKPVFYVRPEIMASLLAYAPNCLRYCGEGSSFQPPKLCNVELYVTHRKEAPDISLALEPMKEEV